MASAKMVQSGLPNPWTQQFDMLCLAVEAWYSCISQNDRWVTITRQTFKELGFADATISDFLDYLRRAGLAVPVSEKRKEFRNILEPTKTGLLDIRNLYGTLISRLKSSSALGSADSLEVNRFEKLKERSEKIYTYLFGEPRG